MAVEVLRAPALPLLVDWQLALSKRRETARRLTENLSGLFSGVFSAGVIHDDEGCGILMFRLVEAETQIIDIVQAPPGRLLTSYWIGDGQDRWIVQTNTRSGKLVSLCRDDNKIRPKNPHQAKWWWGIDGEELGSIAKLLSSVSKRENVQVFYNGNFISWPVWEQMVERRSIFPES